MTGLTVVRYERNPVCPGQLRKTAGLAFLVVFFYLWRRGRPTWFIVLPMCVMLVMPVWALLWQMFNGDTGWWFVADWETAEGVVEREQAAAMLEIQREKERRLPVNTTAAVASGPDCTTTSEALYNKAFYHFQTRHYDQARKGFEQHRQQYTDQLSDNAQFWIGECYFMQQHYEQALTSFQQLLTDFPQSNKVADTLLSVGLCLNRLNQREGAVQKWIMVVEQYPDSTAAAYAQKFLASK